MKYGLVLSGGGSKGAYESGCMKALQELGYHFDIVTGTSIGALNGLLVAQEDYQKLYELWDTLSLEKVLKHPIQFDFSIENLMNNSSNIGPFLKSYLDKKGLKAPITEPAQLTAASTNKTQPGKQRASRAYNVYNLKRLRIRSLFYQPFPSSRT